MASAVASLARRKGWLTRDGAVAATLVGSAVYAGTGLRGSGGMLAFFASSSLLGHLPGTTRSSQRRGNMRDAIQVFANGGIPAMLALMSLPSPESCRTLLLTAFGGAIAAAAADTWATEIGVRYGRNPRSLLTRQPMAPGDSGAISLAGLVASAAGAALVAVVTVSPPGSGKNPQIIAITVGGVVGALADSYFGAAWQEVRFCPACQTTTESLMHACGNRTTYLRGQSWCNNDVVNVIAVATGALAAVILYTPLARGHHTSQEIPACLTSGATGRVEFTSRAMLGALLASIQTGASA